MQRSWRAVLLSLIPTLLAGQAFGGEPSPVEELVVVEKYRSIDPALRQGADPSTQTSCPTSGMVGFSVSGANHISQGGLTLLGYSTIYTDVSANWPSGGGTFIAPCTGLYSFTISFVKDAFYYDGTTDDVFIHIMHNGASKGFAWSGQGTGHRGTGTYSVVLFLNQGSYVQTFVGSGGGESKRHLAGYNFTGHLVKAWQ